MIREAIILAGGLGTRLRSAVPELPKCLAPVAGRPFLGFVIDSLRMQGIDRFIFSLGYRADAIEAFLQQQYATLDYTVVIEEEPLGTGGAIALAMKKATTEDILVANGDTLFRIDLKKMAELHSARKAACTLALRPMKDFDRYGVMEIEEDGKIISFREKAYYDEGLINGGIYVVNKSRWGTHDFSDKFSFERDYLERFYKDGTFYGSRQEGYFIDIGIPEDFERANRELVRPTLDLDSIDSSWTLFLDRDGVINEERLGKYVLHWSEFIFSSGVLNVFRHLGERFGRVIIITNQRGVTKGLMTEEALQSIHLEMQREVEIVHGRIDRIYYCTDKDERSFRRKPNPGMALDAVRDFPEINLNKSIMVGNKPSDMRFGRAAGMFTVFVRTTNPEQPFPHPDIDLVFPTLADFAAALQP